MASGGHEERGLLTRETPFSYTCKQCNRCCYNKGIPVNPYEVARLAHHLGLSTTDLLDRYTTAMGAFLRSREDGACVFLGEGGCTVHADRPLVCRLYPLGRMVPAEGPVGFVEAVPHPRSEGVYGTEGTVGDFLAGQGIEPFVAAADRYYELYLRLAERVQRLAEPTPPEEPDGPAVPGVSLVMDMDAAVRLACGEESLPDDIEERMMIHLRVVDEWIDGLEASPVPAPTSSSDTGS